MDILQIGRNDAVGYFYYVMELADDASVAADLAPAGSDNSRDSKTSSSTLASHRPQITNPDRYVPKTLAKEVHNRDRKHPAECLELSLCLAKALAHLHKHGLVHRDIKPSNVIFVSDMPKLADIGLVTDVGEARSFVGTEGFIPSEGPGTAQADLDSLGKVIYEICTGKDRQDFPELPTKLGMDRDGAELVELNEIIVKACQSDQRKRYQSAEEMETDVLFLQSGKSLKRLRSLEREQWRTIR